MRIEVELVKETNGIIMVFWSWILDNLSPVHLNGYKLNYIAPIGVRPISDETYDLKPHFSYKKLAQKLTIN